MNVGGGHWLQVSKKQIYNNNNKKVSGGLLAIDFVKSMIGVNKEMWVAAIFCHGFKTAAGVNKRALDGAGD